MPDLVFSTAGGALVREKFRQFNITLPAVQKAGPNSPGRVMPPGPSALPGLRLPTTQMLFRAASNSPADVVQQRTMHDLYDAMFQQLIAAIEAGFNLYRKSAGLVEVIVNGPSAIGGRLQGPGLDALILSAPGVAAWTSPKAAMRDAVARGLGQQWSRLEDSVKVPGLPWYPTFTAVPAPIAPPTPNIPSPFMQLTQDPGATAPTSLKMAMRASLKGKFDYSDEFFESISTGFDSALRVWKTVQMVTGVMGTGPVPNFAPPYIPVGMVVGGTILPGSHINT